MTIKLFPFTVGDKMGKQTTISATPAKPKGQVKTKAKDQFVQPGANEKDVILKLKNEVLQEDFILNRRLTLTQIAKNHWSDSPEFAYAFLYATQLVYPIDPELEQAMEKAILSLLPKETDPPKILDRAHALAKYSILSIFVGSSNFRGNRERKIQFIQELTEQRPRYKDFFRQILTLKSSPVTGEEADLIRELTKITNKSFYLIEGPTLAKIAQNHWSDSPEFAREFLLAAVRSLYHPDLKSKIKRAILNLIPKNTDPPQDLNNLDESHHLIASAIHGVLISTPLQSPDRVNFVRELAEERPRYKDFLCESARVFLLKKPGEVCW